MREAGDLVGKSVAWISHLENGRVDLTSDHFKILLPLYGQTQGTFKSYLLGDAFLGSPLRSECLDLFNSMSDDVIEAIHPILTKLVSKKEFRS